MICAATMSTASSIEPVPSLTPAQSSQQIAEARAALEASMLNIGSSLDSDLKTRAANLHSNNAALEKQQVTLAQATKGLAKETAKLKKVADGAAKKLKELGNVQNWAEVLERDFVVLDETLRMVERGSDGEEDELCERCAEDLSVCEEMLVVWCEKCDRLWHVDCVGLDAKPAEKWTCAECQLTEGGRRDGSGHEVHQHAVTEVENTTEQDQDLREDTVDIQMGGVEPNPEKIREEVSALEADAGSSFTHIGTCTETGTEVSSSHVSTSGTD